MNQQKKRYAASRIVLLFKAKLEARIGEYVTSVQELDKKRILTVRDFLNEIPRYKPNAEMDLEAPATLENIFDMSSLHEAVKARHEEAVREVGVTTAQNRTYGLTLVNPVTGKPEATLYGSPQKDLTCLLPYLKQLQTELNTAVDKIMLGDEEEALQVIASF